LYLSDFTYLVVDNSGKEKKGNISAQTREEAVTRLKSDGFLILNVEKANALTKEIDISIGSSIKPRDLSVFCRQFISMVNAGVTILDTLDMLAEQTENKTMAKAIRGVHAQIQKGETLAEGLARYPKVFPEIMVNMVAAGEASGKLDIAFERMAVHFEKSAKMRGLIKKSAMYPILVAIVALGVVVVMLVKVIPSYQDMFDQMGGELPGVTLAMVAASDFLIHRWYVILAVILAVVFGINLYKKTVSGQILFGNLARTIPIFGKLTIKTAASNYARTLSTLIYSGLPMMEALAITANTMGNYIYKEGLLKAKEEVAKGVPLSEPIIASELYPPMVGHMTRIGEETGDLEGMLNRLADYYDEEVEMTTQTVMAALEPIVILLLAAIVGVLIAAIMSPMLAMYAQMDTL
jgi:type IV pilus assembly protein PilC